MPRAEIAADAEVGTENSDLGTARTVKQAPTPDSARPQNAGRDELLLIRACPAQ
jgi:hypothetical protein